MMELIASIFISILFILITIFEVKKIRKISKEKGSLEASLYMDDKQFEHALIIFGMIPFINYAMMIGLSLICLIGSILFGVEKVSDYIKNRLIGL